jgi:hypothetical protein
MSKYVELTNYIQWLMEQNTITRQQFAKALNDGITLTNSNVFQIAPHLGVCRSSLTRWVQAGPTTRECFLVRRRSVLVKLQAFIDSIRSEYWE